MRRYAAIALALCLGACAVPPKPFVPGPQCVERDGHVECVVTPQGCIDERMRAAAKGEEPGC